MPNASGDFDAALISALSRWKLPTTPIQLQKLQSHFKAVIKANRSMNLTRITDPLEAAVKHYADSLALLLWVRAEKVEVGEVLDVGTGAGFPAVPLAVMQPDWLVTAIDATGKKADFLKRTATTIGLKNLRCKHAHSQHWKQSTLRGQHSALSFQLVVFRALTALPKSLEQTAKYVARGGWLVAYKTASVDQGEQDAAEVLTPKLRLSLHDRYAYDLELHDETINRALYVYRKSS